MRTTLLTALTLAALGCSESRTLEGDAALTDSAAQPDSATRPDASAPPTDTAAQPDSATRPDVVVLPDVAAPDASAPPDVAAPDATVASLVINEVRAIGEDWVELYNPGSTPVDLAAFGLTDTDTSIDGGAPRVTGALRFPAGATLGPGQYAVVLADLADAGTGTDMNCLMGAVMRCYTTTWGISASRGETVYLLDTGGRVVAQVAHPPEAMLMTGQTWCRLPDGTGPYAACRPTPGAANRAP